MPPRHAEPESYAGSWRVLSKYVREALFETLLVLFQLALANRNMTYQIPTLLLCFSRGIPAVLGSTVEGGDLAWKSLF